MVCVTMLSLSLLLRALVGADAADGAAHSSLCPAGTLAVGATPDGTWQVCERTLSIDAYGAMVPAGRLEYIAANGTRVVLNKTSEQMYGCKGQTHNASAGCYLGLGFSGVQRLGVTTLLQQAAAAGTDPSLQQVDSMYPAMVYDGGYNKEDPAHSMGKAWGPQPGGWNVHTWVGSRSASVDVAFDSNAGDVGNAGHPSMNQFHGKYGRSTATFKDSMSIYEQREGLWGDYLPVISFHFKIAGDEARGNHTCPVPRKPCPAHPGRTFCPSNTDPHQCSEPPPPTPGPPTPLPHCNCAAGYKPCTTTTPPIGGPGCGRACVNHPKSICCNHCKNQSNLMDSVKAQGTSAGGWIEYTAVPVPDMGGNMWQDVFFRISKYNATGDIIDARYYDTYGYRSLDGVDPSTPVPGMGHSAGSEVAARFYQTLLDSKVFWDNTMAFEGTTKFFLPNRNGTDGMRLAHHTWHHLVRDQIIRMNTWFPKYGVLPNVYGHPATWNCDLTIVASLNMGLHAGAFDWSRGVMENFLRYGMRYDGIRYRGPDEITRSQQLTLFALYWHYTGDPTEIFTRHHDTIMVLVNQLRAVRAHAKTLPKSSPAYGIPTGNTVDDDSGTTIECGTTYGTNANFPRSGSQADGKHDCVTQLPDFDIAFHTIVAFREIAEVFAQFPGLNRTQEAKALLREADDLRDDVLTAMQRSKVSGEDKLVNGRNISCIPCHPGWISCKNPAPRPHFSKPTADVMCGAMAASQAARAVLPPAMFQDIYDYSYDPTAVQTRVDGWACGDDCLSQDNIEGFLIRYFGLMSHESTRGTWTCSEVAGFPRTAASSGTSTVCVKPDLKFMFVWESSASAHPWPTTVVDATAPTAITHNRTLWLGKAIPRVWLAAGEVVAVEGASARGGRISLRIEAASESLYKVNVTLPSSYAKQSWPSGGIRLRIRSPAFPHKKISTVTVGGKRWGDFNATRETVEFREAVAELAAMQDIVVTLA